MRFRFCAGAALLLYVTASACDGSPTQQALTISVVEVSGPDSSIAVRESSQLSVRALMPNGKVWSGNPPMWTVSDTAIAEVSATGLVTGRAPGSVTVSAMIGGVSGQLALTVEAARFTDVIFGSDVPAAARAASVIILSAIDSANIATGVRVPLDGSLTPVFAINNSGQAILATSSRGPSTLEISVNSTARTMVESVLVAPMTGVSDSVVRSLRTSIEGHPRFHELTTAVSASAGNGNSFLDSENSLTLAAAIAADVARAHSQVTAQLQVESSVLPVTVIDAAGTNYILRNRTFLPFAVTAYNNEDGAKIAEAVLPEREISIDHYPWKFGGDTEITVEGRDAEVRLEIGQNAETKQRRVVKAVSDVIGGIHTALGLAVPSGSTSFAVQLVGNATPEQALAIAEAPSREAFYLVTNLLWGQKELIAEWISASSGKRVAKLFSQIAVKQLLGIWGKAEAVAFFAERAPYYIAWNLYAGQSDAIIICQEQGVFSECTERVEVSPASSRISPGSSVQLSARVLGVRGTELTTQRSITWSSADSDIATVDQTGKVVAHSRSGQVKISATSGSKTGFAFVTVAPGVAVDSLEINPRVTTLIVGDSVTLTATGRDAAGNVIRGRQITWAILEDPDPFTGAKDFTRLSRTTGATVVVHGIAARPIATFVSATVDGRKVYATIMVQQAPTTRISALMISPETWPLRGGDSATFYATVRDWNGAMVKRQSISWRTGVGSDGLSISRATGASTTATALRAYYADEVRGEIDYLYQESFVSNPHSSSNTATVSVSPLIVNLAVGESTELKATARDGAGNVLEGKTFYWSNSDATKLVIHKLPNGRLEVKAVGIGFDANTVTLVVNVEGVTSSVNVNVVLPPD